MSKEKKNKKEKRKIKSEENIIDKLGLIFEDDNGVRYMSTGCDALTGEILVTPVSDLSGNLLS